MFLHLVHLNREIVIPFVCPIALYKNENITSLAEVETFALISQRNQGDNLRKNYRNIEKIKWCISKTIRYVIIITFGGDTCHAWNLD